MADVSSDSDVDVGSTEYSKLNKMYDQCLLYLENVQIQDKAYVEHEKGSQVEINECWNHEEKTAITEHGDELNNTNVNNVMEYKNNKLGTGNIFVNEDKNNKNNNFNTDDNIDIKISMTDNQSESTADDSSDNEEESEHEMENEIEDSEQNPFLEEPKSDRLKAHKNEIPNIIITQSNTSLNKNNLGTIRRSSSVIPVYGKKCQSLGTPYRVSPTQCKPCLEHPHRLVSKQGTENVALISNVPFERLRLLNDTFHTLINLRWRWIVSGTVVVHFGIWLVFAVFWYIAAKAHYDFEPDPPQKPCITGGTDFLTIFLASVEAQTTIGFGDRTIDEECPESIFLFIVQLILGTGLSGILSCVVYAKLTRPEKLSRDGVGFSKNAVISIRDGKLCLMLRAWDLHHDHIINSDFSAHFVKTYKTTEGEVIRYYARCLELQARQFLLWPVVLVHVIDKHSPLYDMTPENFMDFSYEIMVSLKGASASMGTFTQSQTSYLPEELLWGYRFPSVVRYHSRKQKYVIDHKKLDEIEEVETPLCSARQFDQSARKRSNCSLPSPGSFSDKISAFKLERSSSFRWKNEYKF